MKIGEGLRLGNWRRLRVGKWERAKGWERGMVKKCGRVKGWEIRKKNESLTNIFLLNTIGLAAPRNCREISLFIIC